MIRNIVTDEAAVRVKSGKVKVFDRNLRALLDDMWQTLDASNGVGLSAIQIGEPARVLVARWQHRAIELVNPCVLKAKLPMTTDEEGCLSLPGVKCMIQRHSSIVVQGRDATGKQIQLSATGMLARIIEHELDHLDGVLITDRGPVMREPKPLVVVAKKPARARRKKAA